MTDNFPRNVMVSVSGHILLLAVIFLRAAFMPQEHFELHDAIRVDIVGLPQKMDPAQELAPPPVKSVAPTVPEKKSNTAKAEKNALDRIKEMEALDKLKDEMNKAPTKPKPNVVAGNQVAVGNSLTGLEKIEFDRYFDELKNKIHGQFSQPQFLADADLSAQVLVLIDDRGFVTKKVIRKTSGNGIFDAAVIEAIDNSSPLPQPPQRLRALLMSSGILFNFPQ